MFYTLLLMTGCLAVIVREYRWQLVGTGLVFGFVTLVKAQTLVVVPLLFAIDWLRMKPMGKRLPGLVLDGMVVLATAAVVISPRTMLTGRFYRDKAQEYAAVFNIDDPAAGKMTGISIGKRP